MRKQTTTTPDDDGAQIHTLEGFAAAFLIMGAIMFAFQSVSITPTSSSTASQAVETQNFKLTDDALAAAAASGDLQDGLLNWSDSNRRYEGAERHRYYEGAPGPGNLGEMLNETFLSRGIAYNLEIRCDGQESGRTWVTYGDPSKHAVTSTQKVILHDDDNLTSSDDHLTLDDTNWGIYCDNVDPDSDIYNVVEVKITVWRM